MSDVKFRAEFYPAELNRKGIVSVSASYGEKIGQYEQPIAELNQLGYYVAAYDYSSKVLLSGEPEYLLGLVDAIHDNFANRAERYKRQRHTGASLGSLIAIN